MFGACRGDLARAKGPLVARVFVRMGEFDGIGHFRWFRPRLDVAVHPLNSQDFGYESVPAW
jgi:hypothetical protein